MNDIRYAEPIKVLQHWGYSVALVKWGDNDNMSLLVEPYCHKSKTSPEVKQRINDLHYQLKELANRDIYNGKLYSRDNKEVYLFETVEGEKIAVYFKDGNAHFGGPDYIRAHDGRTIRGVKNVVDVQGKLINYRGEVVKEETPILVES